VPAVETEREKVRERVREIITRLAPRPDWMQAPSGSFGLVEQLGFDSLALLELAFAVEEAFALPPMDLQTASTIQSSADLEAYVLREIGAG
jgi:acyl carrier protein